MKKIAPSFKVINWDFNSDNIEYYNIMPYIIDCWKEDKKKKHKIWAIWFNNEIDDEDIRLGHSKGLMPNKAIEKNLSKKSKIDDTKMPQTFEEFKFFIDKYCFNRFWSRCEYEVIVTGWPVQKNEVKIDIYDQISNNIDIITESFMNYIIN